MNEDAVNRQPVAGCGLVFNELIEQLSLNSSQKLSASTKNCDSI